MNNESRPSIKNIDVIILSFFGVGFFPFAPGTMGSLATIPILLILLYFNIHWIFIVPMIIILFCISCFLANSVQKKFNLHDPSWIVIDEVLGMLVSFLFFSGPPWKLIYLFILFRFFDITKIWPANYVDKNIKNGIGVILDDIISALYAGASFFLIEYLLKNTA